MSRSISNISAGASATSGDYYLFLSTSELSGSSTDYGTRDVGATVPVVIDPNVAIGPELDWRGGLAAWSSITVQLAQGFDQLAGTSTDNTFELLKDLPTWAQVQSSDRFVQHWLNRNEVVNLYVASKTTGSSWSTNFVKIYTGYIRNLSQSDFGPLAIEIGPKRETYLKSPFLRRLGLESEDHNYDARSAVNDPNPFNTDAKGDAVPLLYGTLDHAESVAPHLTPTDDSSTGAGGRHGLILCFSDVLYDCDTSATPTLYITSERQQALEVQRTDANGDVQYRVMTSSNAADFIGDTTNLVGQGMFIGFTDDLGPANAGGAGDGFLLARKVMPMRRAAMSFKQGGTTWSNGDLDDDDSTSLDGTNWLDDGTFPDLTELYLMAGPDEEFSKDFKYVFARFKLTTSASVTWEIVLDEYQSFSTFNTPSGTLTQTIGSSPSGTSTNNWTAGSAIAYGFAPASTLSTTKDGFALILDPNTTGFNWSVFGGQFDVWYEYGWGTYWERIYGDVRGIYDVSYDRASGTYLEHPAEQFAHLTAVVLGGTVDATAWESSADDQDADSVVTDFQLTDADELGEDVLEKLAVQSMSWIVPNDGAQEQFLYRLGIEGDDDQAQAPFDRSNIIKGSFNWGMTSRDDHHRGCIVNYAWSALESRYREQAIIAPTSSDFETNITHSVTGGGVAADYTDFVDDIALDDLGMLRVNAEYIQDTTTAEMYCKWLTLLHGRRRQMIEFDTFLEYADITAGDLIYVNMPQIRAYASGNQFDFGVSSLGFIPVTSDATTFEPSGDTNDKGLGAAHHEDLMVVESGTYEGSFRLTWSSGSSQFNTAATGNLAAVSNVSVSDPWRVLPGFDVLSAQIVYTGDAGPRLHIKAVEHPVLLPQATKL